MEVIYLYFDGGYEDRNLSEFDPVLGRFSRLRELRIEQGEMKCVAYPRNGDIDPAPDPVEWIDICR